MAQDLDIDIWDEVMDYVKAHPLNTTGLDFLISGLNNFYTEQRSKQFLDFFQQHLKQYLRKRTLCLHLCDYLEASFGDGIPILAAFLTGPAIEYRFAAAYALRHWPPEHIDLELDEALRQALVLPNDPDTRKMLQELLSKDYKPFPVLYDDESETDEDDEEDDEPDDGPDGGGIGPVLN
jgi:hypothetical protein